MKSIRKVLAAVKRADAEFNLINSGDKIVIGVSGGKDSLVLVHALMRYQRFPHKDFTIYPVILDLGFPNTNLKPLSTYFKSLGLNLIIEDCKDVYAILKIQQKHHPHLPCSICSRMKKAAINKVANELGCNKVAFAHHADDAIETLLMNSIFGGRLATFAPKMHLENANIDFIRPCIYVREDDISATARALEIPVMSSPCPSNTHTMREEAKLMLSNLYTKYPYAKENFLTMLTNYQKADLWFHKLDNSIAYTDLSVREIMTKNDAILMMKIREKVFVEEFHVDFDDEIDNEDLIAHHFLLFKNKVPIGTIRYVVYNKDIHLGRFAILSEYRNLGYGKYFFKYILDFIKANHKATSISLNAMSYASKFYEKFEFVTEGETFDECNIPHIKMVKYIKY